MCKNSRSPHRAETNVSKKCTRVSLIDLVKNFQARMTPKEKQNKARAVLVAQWIVARCSKGDIMRYLNSEYVTGSYMLHECFHIFIVQFLSILTHISQYIVPFSHFHFPTSQDPSFQRESGCESRIRYRRERAPPKFVSQISQITY